MQWLTAADNVFFKYAHYFLPIVIIFLDMTLFCTHFCAFKIKIFGSFKTQFQINFPFTIMLFYWQTEKKNILSSIR